MPTPKPCIRCLLAESGNIALADEVKDAIRKLPEKERAADALYEKRLQICKECEDLFQGTCLKCGCYVELRAAAKCSRCPSVKKKW